MLNNSRQLGIMTTFARYYPSQFRCNRPAITLDMERMFVYYFIERMSGLSAQGETYDDGKKKQRPE